jgi:hypothetical protein
MRFARMTLTHACAYAAASATLAAAPQSAAAAGKHAA